MRLDSPRLLVDDLPACLRFYRDVLGLTVLEGASAGPLVHLGIDERPLLVLEDRRAIRERVGWRPQQVQVGLTLVLDVEEEPPAKVGDDRVVVVLAVDDVRTLFERLHARGANIVARPHERIDLRRVYGHVRDPAGNLLEFHSPL